MCITTKAAELSSTKILSIPIKEHGTHFLAYSNKVRNTSGQPNAMIFAIPGITKQEWFHDTTKYKDFLDEIIDKASLNEWMGTKSYTRGADKLSKSLSFEEFALGIYTVGLASSFDGAEEFIASLSEDKRPEVSNSLRAFFREKYAGWSFAVCCFDAGEAIDSQPIAFEYAPFNPGFLYFPTMDAHDGNAPRMDRKVEVDHVFIFEHTGVWNEGLYQMDSITMDAPVLEFLNKRRYRTREMYSLTKNGDTYIKIADMNALDFSKDPELLRASPVPYDIELSSPEMLKNAIDDIIR